MVIPDKNPNAVKEKKKKKKKKKKMKIMECLTSCSYISLGIRILLAKSEFWFEKLGRAIAEHPKRCIFLSLTLVTLCGLGLLNLRTETEIEKLFIPVNTESERDLKSTMPYFVNLFNSREQSVILESINNAKLLNIHCLKQAEALVTDITNSSPFQSICLRKTSFVKNVLQYNQSQPCYMINPLETIHNLSNGRNDLNRALADKNRLMSNGRTAEENRIHMLPTSYSANRSILTSLKFVFFLNEYKEKEKRAKVLKWETEFTKRMKNYNSKISTSRCFSVKYFARRSLDDSIIESTGKDIPLFSIAFALMITFTRFVLGKFSNPIQGHATLSTFGVLSTAFGILAGFGFAALVGVPFVSIVGLLSFLVLSIGVDDMFIIIDEFDKQKNDAAASVKVGNTMAKIGATITMTTLTDIVAFVISAFSSFPAIQYFCIFAAITFTAEFLLQITFFIAFLWYDARRISVLRRDCLPVCRGQDRKLCSSAPNNNISKIAMKKYAQLLISLPGKIMIISIAIGLLVFGIYGCIHIKDTFDRRFLSRKGTYIVDYLNTFENEYSQLITVNIVQKNKVNYEDRGVQNEILNAPKVAATTGYYLTKSHSWLEEYIKWSNNNTAQLKKASFSKKIETFLSIPKYSSFKADLYFDNKNNLVASQTQIFMKQTTSSAFQRDAMMELRKVFKKENINLTPTADQFLYFEQYASVLHEIIRNICISAIVILIITAPFCMHLLISLGLLIGFILLIVELFGLMYFWDVYLNSVSMIYLVMSIGFTVDYSAHVAYAFVTSKKKTTEEKIIDALSTIGASVLLGGLSTFIGILPTGFASSSILNVFFKMLLGIVIIGLFNGLALLPVLFSFFGWAFSNESTTLLIESIIAKEKKREKTRKERLSDNIKGTSHPVSVVGIAARFPTVRNKDGFWQLLVDGKNTLSDYPLDREQQYTMFKENYNPYRGMQGRLYVTKGSYLEDMDYFDNNFFGISHSEAKMMDPQQRILLQGVFEAIEDAGITVQEIQSVTTGVYVGAMNLDYTAVVPYDHNIGIDQFTGTGTAGSIISNRISFALNLRGPSITVDTACSSSSTALSIALDHLKGGKCDIAIVGASNIIVDHMKQLILCQAMMLAPDGQCKSFDARCDGYGRGEGMVVVILKACSNFRLSDKSIYCNILACNMNSDGQSSIPMTAPSVEGQSRLFEATCMEAGIKPNRVEYLEAHGTGTVIGDLVETQSISHAYCRYRDQKNPLLVGSLKSNVNHTESAAGLAGLAKVCLMMENKILVPTVGIQELNSKLGMANKALYVVQQCTEWVGNPSDLPRCAAINSFGFGGSNAHIIVREPEHTKDKDIFDAEKALGDDKNRVMLLLVSAKSKQALIKQAEVFADWLSEKHDDTQTALDICYSLALRRTIHNHRLSISFKNLRDACQKLKTFASNENAGMLGPSVSYSRVKFSSPDIAFVFSGQGTYWDSMIESLSEHSKLKVYFDKVEQELYKSEMVKSFLKDMKTREGKSSFQEPIILKPNKGNTCLVLNNLTKQQLDIFKVEYAVCQLLIEKCNITPKVVIGHSLGDIVAACVSGNISLMNAIEIIIIRSELQNLCRVDGKMAALGMSDKDTQNLIEELELTEKVEIAAVNDAGNVTISGDEGGIHKIVEYLRSSGRKANCKILATAKAYHSHHMDEIKQLFWEYAKRIKFKSKWSATQFISSVYAKLMETKEIKAAYWWDNVRESVKFYDTVKRALELNCKVFVEISPRPVLKSYLYSICKSFSSKTKGEEMEVLTCFPKSSVEEKIDFLYSNCIGELFNIGCSVNFGDLFAFQNAQFVRYPTYCWQETKFWPKIEKTVDNNKKILLGNAMGKDTNGDDVFKNEIDLHKHSFLKDHILRDVGVAFPGAGYVEIVLEAVLDGFEPQGLVLENQRFEKIFSLSEDKVYYIKTIVRKWKEAGKLNVDIYNVINDQEILLSTCKVTKMKEHASGRPLSQLVLSEDHRTRAKEYYDIGHIKRNAEKTYTRAELQEITHGGGIECKDGFSIFEKGWQMEGRLLVKMKLPDCVANSLDKFVIHPSIIDGCLQSMLVALSGGDGVLVIPVAFRKMILFPITNTFTHFYCIINYVKGSPEKTIAQVISENGEPLFIFQTVEVVALNKIQTKLTFEASFCGVKYNPISLGNETNVDFSNLNWIIIGLKNYAVHNTFFKYLENYGICNNCLNVVEFENDIETSSNENHERPRLINYLSNNKNNIVVNFVPACLKDWSNQREDIEIIQRIIFYYCFDTAQELFNHSNCRIEYVTTEDIIISDSKQFFPNVGAKQSKYPLCSLIWGIVKGVRMERPSLIIQCADISKFADASELQLLMNHCSQEPNEPDVVIRKNNCYSPRLYAVEDTTNRNEILLNKCDLSNAPHYLTITQQGRLQVIEGENPKECLPQNVEIDVVSVSTLVGKIKQSPPLIDKKVQYDNKQVFCISGRIKKCGNEISNNLLCKNVMCFHYGNRIYNKMHVDRSKIVNIPGTLTHEEVTVTAGYLILASLIVREAKSKVSSCHSCLIAFGKTNSELSFALSIAAKACNLDVSTTDIKYDDGMARLGIEFVSIFSITDQSQFKADKMEKYDCIIFPMDLNGGEKKILASAVREEGLYLGICCQAKDTLQNHTGFPSYYHGTQMSIFDCMNVTEEEALNEWATICPYLQDTSNIWAATLQRPFDVIDPYTSSQRNDFIEFPSYCTFNLNSTKQAQVKLEKCTLDHFGVKQERTYLVVGGHKGLGQETTLWLADLGATHLVTCGRSKLPSDAIQMFKEESTKRTCVSFHHVVCDITTLQGIEILETKLKLLPKLAGIVCSAVVYDDKLIADIGYESFKKVLNPKVIGTIRLYEMVCGLNVKLDFFILYSSIVSAIGNVGQTSYTAANFFMNEFANQMKQQTGQNFLSVCWGPMSGAGFLSQNEDIASLITEKMGLNMIPIETGLEWLKTVLLNHSNMSTVVLNSFNWRVINKRANPLKSSKILQQIIPVREDDRNSSAYLDLLKNLSYDEKWEKIGDYMREWFAKRLGTLDASEIDLRAPLSQYGLDSAGAMEFQAKLEEDFTVSIPVFELLRPDSNAAVLIGIIIQQLHNEPNEVSTHHGTDQDTLEEGQSDLELELQSTDLEDLKFDDEFCSVAWESRKAYANFFWIHASHRYRGGMLPVSEGFKIQEVFKIYSIGSGNILHRAGDTEEVRPLARAYVDLIRRKQPRGPYFLGGHSFGGMIAYEMASVLTSLREEVSMVVMVDTYPWISGSHSNTTSLYESVKFSPEDIVKNEIQELSKSIAVHELGMEPAEFDQIQKENDMEYIIQHLHHLSEVKSIKIIDIKELQKSFLHNVMMSTKGHKGWYPPKKMYKESVLFVEATDKSFTPDFTKLGTNAQNWKNLIRPNNFYHHSIDCNHLNILSGENGHCIGKIVSTMARFILRQYHPSIYQAELISIDRVSLQTLKDGLTVILGGKKEGIEGILKANCVKQKLKFKEKKLARHVTQKKFTIHFQDIANVLKASEDQTVQNIISTMGITVWTNRGKIIFYFKTWFDYIRVANGLQAVFGMRLPLI